jgi:hypothetical protein
VREWIPAEGVTARGAFQYSVISCVKHLFFRCRLPKQCSLLPNLPLKVEKLLLWQIASSGIQKVDANSLTNHILKLSGNQNLN